MESVIVACVTGVVTLVGVLASNSKSRAVMEFKIDALASKVEKHNYNHPYAPEGGGAYFLIDKSMRVGA